MNSLYMMSEVKVLIFSLILIRMTAFIISAPVFGSPQISIRVKILFCLVLSVCLFPTIPVDLKLYEGLSNNIITLAAREVLVGICLGFICRIFFYAISMTGELISVSLGLNAAQMFNPMMGSPGNVIEQFYNILGILFFFMVNGHHMLISGLAMSFDFVKVGEMSFNYLPLGEIATLGGIVISIAIKLCAPVMVAVFLAHVAMGLLGRAIPQLNVLVTSFPVTVMIGLAVMFICVPLYIDGLNNLLEMVAGKLVQTIKAI